jgi:hypothetical protein
MRKNLRKIVGRRTSVEICPVTMLDPLEPLARGIREGGVIPYSVMLIPCSKTERFLMQDFWAYFVADVS